MRGGFLDGASGGESGPSLSVFVFQTCKCPLEKNDVMLAPYREELNVGSDYIFCSDGDETVLRCLVKIGYNVDSGAEVACLSQSVACDKQFPVEERKIPEPLLASMGRLMLGRREDWMEKSHVLRDEFRITISYVEIVDMIADHKLIIPETCVRDIDKTSDQWKEKVLLISIPDQGNATSQTLKGRQKRRVVKPP